MSVWVIFQFGNVPDGILQPFGVFLVVVTFRLEAVPAILYHVRFHVGFVIDGEREVVELRNTVDRRFIVKPRALLRPFDDRVDQVERLVGAEVRFGVALADVYCPPVFGDRTLEADWPRRVAVVEYLLGYGVLV